MRSEVGFQVRTFRVHLLAAGILALVYLLGGVRRHVKSRMVRGGRSGVGGDGQHGHVGSGFVVRRRRGSGRSDRDRGHGTDCRRPATAAATDRGSGVGARVVGGGSGGVGAGVIGGGADGGGGSQGRRGDGDLEQSRRSGGGRGRGADGCGGSSSSGGGGGGAGVCRRDRGGRAAGRR